MGKLPQHAIRAAPDGQYARTRRSPDLAGYTKPLSAGLGPYDARVR
ncbi:hypothetical protein BAY1663_03562 [Pseudomonas sp. BAY1663]|nr:hypothetical protein BAY1663_03562 [Pseudomonas sp. BAY1663]